MSESMSTAATHVFEDIEVEAAAEAGPSSMGDAAASLSLEAAFDIETTAQIILEGGYKTVRYPTPVTLADMLDCPAVPRRALAVLPGRVPCPPGARRQDRRPELRPRRQHVRLMLSRRPLVPPLAG
jgi:hypothetical protein